MVRGGKNVEHVAGADSHVAVGRSGYSKGAFLVEMEDARCRSRYRPERLEPRYPFRFFPEHLSFQKLTPVRLKRAEDRRFAVGFVRRRVKPWNGNCAVIVLLQIEEDALAFRDAEIHLVAEDETTTRGRRRTRHHNHDGSLAGPSWGIVIIPMKRGAFGLLVVGVGQLKHCEVHMLLNGLDAYTDPSCDLRIGHFLNPVQQKHFAPLRWHGVDCRHDTPQALRADEATFWIGREVHKTLPCLQPEQYRILLTVPDPPEGDRTDYAGQQVVNLANFPALGIGDNFQKGVLNHLIRACLTSAARDVAKILPALDKRPAQFFVQLWFAACHSVCPATRSQRAMSAPSIKFCRVYSVVGYSTML